MSGPVSTWVFLMVTQAAVTGLRLTKSMFQTECRNMSRPEPKGAQRSQKSTPLYNHWDFLFAPVIFFEYCLFVLSFWSKGVKKELLLPGFSLIVSLSMLFFKLPS